MKVFFYKMMIISVQCSNFNCDLRTKISNSSHSVAYENFQECLVDLHLMTTKYNELFNENYANQQILFFEN